MEEKIQSEHLKRLQLEEEPSHSKLVLKETTLHHQFQNQQLVCHLNKTQTELKKAHKENKFFLLSNKNLASVVVEQAKKKRQDIKLSSRQQQWVRRKQHHNSLNCPLLFLENEGIKATSLTMLHTESHKVEIESRLKERVRVLIKNRKINCGDTLFQVMAPK